MKKAIPVACHCVSSLMCITAALCWYIPVLFPIMGVYSYLAFMLGIVIVSVTIAILAQEIAYNHTRKLWLAPFHQEDKKA